MAKTATVAAAGASYDTRSGPHWNNDQHPPTHLPTHTHRRDVEAGTAAASEDEAAVGEIPDWPSEGVIKFDNVSMRYRPELGLALHDLRCVSSFPIGFCTKLPSC